MSEKPEQNFANHTVFPALFIIQAAGVLAAVIIAAVGFFMLHESMGPKLISFAVILHGLVSISMVIKLRTNSLMVQDRVVRLETQVRLERILPDDLKEAARGLTLAQLIGLRFASDAEISELVRKVLAENIQSGKEIKQLVKDWQPDHMRI